LPSNLINELPFVDFYGWGQNETNLKGSIQQKKDGIADYKFSICIENSSNRNYHTEKIIDAFLSKTVPIYWGCSNIGNFFNQKGIIIFSNINECIENCNNIQEDVYEKMLPYIEENYVKSKSFIDWKKNLTESINKLNIK
jgi:hypothetical protein